jgi:hypothetical protein
MPEVDLPVSVQMLSIRKWPHSPWPPRVNFALVDAQPNIKDSCSVKGSMIILDVCSAVLFTGAPGGTPALRLAFAEVSISTQIIFMAIADTSSNYSINIRTTHETRSPIIRK